MFSAFRQQWIKEMKIIFLDMDGVMVTPRACLMYGDKGIFSYIDPVAVHAINSLCKRSDAKIVISSSWRGWMPVRAMKAILSGAGIQQDYFYFDGNNLDDSGFFTPKLTELGMLRGHQIKQWLNDNPGVDNYLILDDDSDMLPEQWDHFVETHVYDGISHQNFLDAEKILGIRV